MPRRASKKRWVSNDEMQFMQRVDHGMVVTVFIVAITEVLAVMGEESNINRRLGLSMR